MNAKDDDRYLFEMANVHKSDSKLPVNLYFIGCGEATYHDAIHVKVQLNRDDRVDPDNLAALEFLTTPGHKTISDIRWVYPDSTQSEISDCDLDRIVCYVKKNWDTVVKHWCGELTDKQFLSAMPEETNRCYT